MTRPRPRKQTVPFSPFRLKGDGRVRGFFHTKTEQLTLIRSPKDTPEMQSPFAVLDTVQRKGTLCPFQRREDPNTDTQELPNEASNTLATSNRKKQEKCRKIVFKKNSKNRAMQIP